MRDLGLPRGYVVHAGREAYSLGGAVRALPVVSLLARPDRLARL